MLYKTFKKEIITSKMVITYICFFFILAFSLINIIKIFNNYQKKQLEGHDIVLSGNYSSDNYQWSLINTDYDILRSLNNKDTILAYGILMNAMEINNTISYFIQCSKSFIIDNIDPYIMNGEPSFDKDIIYIGDEYANLSGLKVNDIINNGDIILKVGAIIRTNNPQYNNSIFTLDEVNEYNKIMINFLTPNGKIDYYDTIHNLYATGYKFNGFSEELYREKDKIIEQVRLYRFFTYSFVFFFILLSLSYMLKGQHRKIAVLSALGYSRFNIIKVYMILVNIMCISSCIIANLCFIITIYLYSKMQSLVTISLLNQISYVKELLLGQIIVYTFILLLSFYLLLNLTNFKRIKSVIDKI